MRRRKKLGRIHHERRVSSNEIHALTHFHPSCLNNVHPLGRGRTSFKQITSALLDFSFCPLQKYLFQMVTMVAFLRCQFFVLSLDFELRLAYNLIKFRPAIQKYRTSYGLWHKIPKSQFFNDQTNHSLFFFVCFPLFFFLNFVLFFFLSFFLSLFIYFFFAIT